jgi:hypothetical protein
VAWNPEKNKDEAVKRKYIQICEAYKKLNSVMEGTEGFAGDESHEIAAFMKMFMNMVGISEHDTIPSAMTFGMVFGAGQHTIDEWSTDEDSNDGYDDDEDEEEYYDEYSTSPNGAHPGAQPVGAPFPSSSPASSSSSSSTSSSFGTTTATSSTAASSSFPRTHPGTAPTADEPSKPLWEPQVKTYSNMNLKDQVSKEKEVELTPEEQEREKKLKAAKKKAEKKKKQKEKKKENSAAAQNDAAASSATAAIPEEQLSPEYKR